MLLVIDQIALSCFSYCISCNNNKWGTGEFYMGVYVLALAHWILESEDGLLPGDNLQGFALGNAVLLEIDLCNQTLDFWSTNRVEDCACNNCPYRNNVLLFSMLEKQQ